VVGTSSVVAVPWRVSVIDRNSFFCSIAPDRFQAAGNTGALFMRHHLTSTSYSGSAPIPSTQESGLSFIFTSHLLQASSPLTTLICRIAANAGIGPEKVDSDPCFGV
jgi:hypothetical protein